MAPRKKTRTTHRRIRNSPSHPLAGSTGLVSEARAVLYDRIGPGPHPCHWCGAEVNWVVGRRGNVRGALLADHLDRDVLNDAPENLVPACATCNTNRNRTDLVGDEEVFVERQGYRHRAALRDCETCGREFAAALDQVTVGKGRFCSRSCARRAPRKK